MKLLVDMNLSPRWVPLLIQSGFEAVHWSALGLAYAPDDEIMAFAALHGYVVFTNDLDFGIILAKTNAKMPSVVQIRAGNLRPEVIGAHLIALLSQLAETLDQGVFVSFDPKRTRVRVLPLAPTE